MRMIKKVRLPMDKIIAHNLPWEKFERDVQMATDGSASLKVMLRP